MLSFDLSMPVCSVSASEFIKMYVGAARVRILFGQAKGCEHCF